MLHKNFDAFEQSHRKARKKLLHPLMVVLEKAGITPNIITNFRLILAIAFLALFNYYRKTSIVLVTISILLDSIDGVLARHLKVDSDRGKFLDISVDVLTFFLILATFWFNGVNPVLIMLVIITTSFAYLFAIVRKNECADSDWIISPKAKCIQIQIIPITAFYLFHLFGINYISELLIIGGVIAFLIFAYNFVLFQRKK